MRFIHWGYIRAIPRTTTLNIGGRYESEHQWRELVEFVGVWGMLHRKMLKAGSLKWYFELLGIRLHRISAPKTVLGTQDVVKIILGGGGAGSQAPPLGTWPWISYYNLFQNLSTSH